MSITTALHITSDKGCIKYSIYTDKIYQAIFREKAKEYKQILNLAHKDNLRETLYAEVLRAISGSFSGHAYVPSELICLCYLLGQQICCDPVMDVVNAVSDHGLL